MVSKTQARNTTQRIGEFLRGSRVTVLGSGGKTESAIGSGVVTTYSPPAGKKARCKVSVGVETFGSNTQITCGVFDNGTGQYGPAVVLTGGNAQAYFETVLTNIDENIDIRGNNAANDGTASVVMSVEELPA